MNRPLCDGPRYAENDWQSPPEQLWQDIQLQLNTPQPNQGRPRQPWTMRLAMAASVCVAAGLLLMMTLKPKDSHAAAIDRWQGYNQKLVVQIDALVAPESLYRIEDLLIENHLQQQLETIGQTLLQATRDEDRLILEQHRAATLLDLLNLQAQAAAANLSENVTDTVSISGSNEPSYYEL